MRITIVTPSFNQGQFIEETIKSIINQEGNFELEYIIMDGGSTDSTIDIIKKYERIINSNSFNPKCKKLIFKWFSEKDKGHSHAVNKGFRMSTGDVLNWICSDDLLEKNSLQELTNFFEENKEAVAVLGDALEIDEKGHIEKKVKGRVLTRRKLIVAQYTWNGTRIVQPSLFVRKKSI